jgi:hypothetical protein
VAGIAAVPIGAASPDAKGGHEFSVILVWVSNAPGARKQDVINEIIS